MAVARVLELPAARRATRQAPARTREDLFAAVVAGQIAGLAMVGLLSLAYVLLGGTNIGHALQVVASVFVGERALDEPIASRFALGVLASQLGPALGWSLVFGLVATGLHMRRHYFAMAMLGLALGAVAMVVDVYALVPGVSTLFGVEDSWGSNVPLAWDWLAHLTYGGALGCLFTDRRGEPAPQRPLVRSST